MKTEPTKEAVKNVKPASVKPAPVKVPAEKKSVMVKPTTAPEKKASSTAPRPTLAKSIANTKAEAQSPPKMTMKTPTNSVKVPAEKKASKPMVKPAAKKAPEVKKQLIPAKKTAPAPVAAKPKRVAKPPIQRREFTGRPPITDTVIPAREAQEALETGKFSMKTLLDKVVPAPGRGRNLKDTDNFRVTGSREFVQAALPIFQVLLDQDEYDVSVDTYEKRDTKKRATGRYTIYVRLRERVEAIAPGRRPKAKTVDAKPAKKVSENEKLKPKMVVNKPSEGMKKPLKKLIKPKKKEDI